jgi:hypothetical protein
MAEKLLRDKIGYKPGMRVLLLGLPEDVVPPFAGIAHAAAPDGGRFDLVLGFVKDRAQLEHVAPVALAAVVENPLLWLAYPKQTGAIKTDLNRDANWAPMFDVGWTVVAIASVDKTWSAVRFRPKHLVKPVRS